MGHKDAFTPSKIIMKRENIHVVVCRISVHMARRRWGTICYISKHYCVINYMLSIIKVLVIMKVRKNIGVNLVEIYTIAYILRNQFAISKTTHWLNTGKTELNMDETFHPKHQDLQRNKFKVFQHHLFWKVIFRIKFLACNSAQRIKVEFTEIAFLVINSQSWDM